MQFKKKKENHTQENEYFNVKYLKPMAKHFKIAFYLSINYYSLYWILQLLTNPIHRSDIF